MTGIMDVNGLLTKSFDDLLGKTNSVNGSETSEAFGNVLSSAMGLLNETNTLANEAQAATIDFALGKADSTHEMTIALQKAAVSLQYTVAIKNQILSAYQEIMQIQI